MTLTQQEKEHAKQRVAEVCLQQISDLGLHAVSTRSVARKLEMSAGWIYNVYSDFNAVVDAANSITQSELDDCLSDATAKATGDPAATLTAFALAYLEFTLANPRRCAALFAQPKAGPRRQVRGRSKGLAAIVRYLEKPLSEVMPDADDETLCATATTIFSAFHGVVSLGLDGGMAPMPVAVIDEQLRALARAFAAGYGRRSETDAA